jgi:probable HAF family extracellular repeat protein
LPRRRSKFPKTRAKELDAQNTFRYKLPQGGFQVRFHASSLEICLSSLCGVLSCVATTALAENYIIIDLGPDFTPFAVSDLGDVVGWTGCCRSFIWNRATGFQGLGSLGGELTYASDINTNRQVVGSSEAVGSPVGAGNLHAFLWQNGHMHDLAPFSYESQALAINNHGQAVGYACFPCSAVLWENNGTELSLGTLGGVSASAQGINDAGAVVGWSFTTNDAIHAFVWDQAQGMRDIDRAESSYSEAYAINNLGQVVGLFVTADDEWHGFLWENGEMRDLGDLGIFGYASINDHGEVVVDSGPWIWDADNGLRDVNDLIPPASGWVIESLSDINNAGEIVGWGLHGGQTRAFLLTPVETAQIGVNCNNDSSMRDGVPDVDFVIDQQDERVKHTSGFNFWWARDSIRGITEQNIVDLAPFVVIVPQKFIDENHDFYLKVEGDAALSSLIVYPAVSPDDNRRAFLQSEPMAARQISQSSFGIIIDNNQEPFEMLTAHAGTNEFLMRAIGSGTATATLKLISRSPGGSELVHDSVKLTLRDTSDYWLFVSTRANSATDNFVYPIDNGQFVSINRYPYPVTISGSRDLSKSQYVVFLHGYNVNQTEARAFFDEMYRRFFWLGFRGNLVGLTWRGDQGNAATLDTNVRNALRTSPAVWRFLRDTAQTQWSVPAENINLIAHSLGNLVMFDALRLQSRLVGAPLVQNVCSLQSATWPEAYELETTFASQQPPGLTYVAPSDSVTYSIDQLKRHSWAFWFGQAGAEVSRAVNGGVYHSYLDTDVVLSLMQYNDWWQRGWLQDWWHYNRNEVLGSPDHYRAPANDNSYHPDLANDMPTLMLPGHRHYRTGFFVLNRYGQEDVGEPVGVQENPMANNYPASLGNWQGPRAFWDLELAQPTLCSIFPVYLQVVRSVFR